MTRTAIKRRRIVGAVTLFLRLIITAAIFVVPVLIANAAFILLGI